MTSPRPGPRRPQCRPQYRPSRRPLFSPLCSLSSPGPLTRGAALALAAALIAAGPGAAEPLTFGEVAAHGRLAPAVRATQGETSLILSGDGDLRLGLGGGVELGLGMLGVATDLTGSVDTRVHETYGTIGWQGDELAIALGVPRPAYDAAALSPLERWDAVHGLAADEMGATRSRATWGAIHAGALPEGLRIGGETPGGLWAVSAHRMEGVRILGAAFALDRAETRIAGGVEWASDGGFGAKVAVERDFATFSAGAAAYVAPAPGVDDLGEAWLSWPFGQSVTLSGLVQMSPGGGGARGVAAAEWEFTPGTRAMLSVSDGRGDSAAVLGVDWRF